MGGRFIPAFCLGFLLLVSATSQAQQFIPVNVKGRVQLSVPSEWAINDGETRQQRKEYVERKTGVTDLNLASFSAQSYPQPSRNMIRVSFVPQDPPITQEDVVQEIRIDRRQALVDVASTWEDEAPSMWAALRKQGITQVGVPRFDVLPLGGKMAVLISYGRTSNASRENDARLHLQCPSGGREGADHTLEP